MPHRHNVLHLDEKVGRNHIVYRLHSREVRTGGSRYQLPADLLQKSVVNHSSSNGGIELHKRQRDRSVGSQFARPEQKEDLPIVHECDPTEGNYLANYTLTLQYQISPGPVPLTDTESYLGWCFGPNDGIARTWSMRSPVRQSVSFLSTGR